MELLLRFYGIMLSESPLNVRYTHAAFLVYCQVHPAEVYQAFISGKSSSYLLYLQYPV
jgi:hypothetical protein